jgi:YD repeat-containing protein
LQHLDGLDRLWLSQQIEDGTSPNCSDTTSGIKTETRHNNSSLGRFQLVSNPYRTTSDATAGWTLTAFDPMNRPTLMGYFAGGTAPAWGNVTPTQGQTTMTYDLVDGSSAGIYDTVSDQQSLKWNFRDGLGRLIEVREKNAPGVAALAYDTLDNLLSVTQAGLTNSACAGSVSRCFTYDSLSRLWTANNTESGATSYAYDDNGNLTQHVLSGVTTASFYDALNRTYLKTYAGGTATPNVTYCYDGQVFGGSDGACTAGSAPYGIGHLTQVGTSASISSSSAFDALGRVTVSAQATTGSPTYSFGYSYNRVGMTTESYPSGRTVTYQYDTVGRVKGVRPGHQRQIEHRYARQHGHWAKQQNYG